VKERTASSFLVSELVDEPDMDELVDHFVAGLVDRAIRIEDALAAGDGETVRSVAHQLRGAAGSYGFPSITVAATRLELALSAGEGADDALHELCDLCRRARARATPCAA
jgi:HPt (histidine-containing phosphotransfer) domain-containing protein